jgi:ABC-2 type transport system permease protein
MIALQVAAETVAAGVEPGSRTKKIGLLRLTSVEVRKLADTRAGVWLLIVIALAAAGTTAVSLGFGDGDDLTFQGLFAFALVPSGLLLPVLGILSMTGEWSQRTAVTTFTLVPARGRVIAAKLAAGGLIAVAVTLATAVIAALAALIAQATGSDGSWHLSAAVAGEAVLMEVLAVLMGLGFGALLLNSSLAIVAYFVVPTVWSILAASIKSLHAVASWLDFQQASGPLVAPGMTGGEWARLGVATALWVVLPLVVGTLRVMRREVS